MTEMKRMPKAADKRGGITDGKLSCVLMKEMKLNFLTAICKQRQTS